MNILSCRDKENKNYNLLKEPVKVELNIVYTTTTKTEWVTDENGVKTLVKNEITRQNLKKDQILQQVLTQKLSSTRAVSLSQ